jgi:hypothetical protein
LVGQLSNPSAALETAFGASTAARLGLRERRRPIAAEPASRRLGNGVVQRAAVKVLASAQRPMCGPEIRAAVEDLLGHSVSRDSVSSCLAAGARRKEPLFARVTRGQYVLASHGRDDR